MFAVLFKFQLFKVEGVKIRTCKNIQLVHKKKKMDRQRKKQIKSKYIIFRFQKLLVIFTKIVSFFFSSTFLSRVFYMTGNRWDIGRYLNDSSYYFGSNFNLDYYSGWLLETLFFLFIPEVHEYLTEKCLALFECVIT